MRKKYTKLEDFIVVATHKDEKLTGFFIADRQGERLSQRDFKLASDAIEYGYELIECKGLLND